MMKYFLETLIFFIAVAAPTSIMLAAAFLIYHNKDGWGWFLFAATLIAGSTKVRFDGFDADKSSKPIETISEQSKDNAR